jgi:hypothetical protein
MDPPLTECRNPRFDLDESMMLDRMIARSCSPVCDGIVRQPSHHAVTVSTSAGNHRQSTRLVTIDTGAISAVFAPSLGGRLLSLTTAGRERLWRNPRELDDTLQLRRPRSSWPDPRGPMSDWVNLGGAKIWPAPQGWSGPAEWPGPPDPVFDGGAWKSRAERLPDGGVRVMLASGDDPWTGLRATRSFEFQPGGTGFAETVRFIATERPARWAIWEVVQVPSAGDRGAGDESSVFVASPDADPVPLVPQLPPLGWRRLPDGRVRVPVVPRVGKLGFPGATGEIEYARDLGGLPGGGALRLRWDTFAGVEYPDGGSRAEVWMQYAAAEPIAELGGFHPDADYVELEVLGPLTRLEPGQGTRLRVDWELR